MAEAEVAHLVVEKQPSGRLGLTPWHLLLVPWTACVAWFTGFFISLQFKVGWAVAVLLTLLTPFFYVPAFFAVLGILNFSRRRRRDFAAILLAYVIGVTLSWTWIRADDAAFLRELSTGAADESRARWWPYSWVDLYRDENGEVSVND